MTNLERYIHLHGLTDLIPIKWFNSNKYKNVEEVYADALDKGVTWRELTDWNVDKDKGIIL